MFNQELQYVGQSDGCGLSTCINNSRHLGDNLSPLEKVRCPRLVVHETGEEIVQVLLACLIPSQSLACLVIRDVAPGGTVLPGLLPFARHSLGDPCNPWP